MKQEEDSISSVTMSRIPQANTLQRLLLLKFSFESPTTSPSRIIVVRLSFPEGDLLAGSSIMKISDLASCTLRGLGLP